LESAKTWGLLEEGRTVAKKAPALFARIDAEALKKELDAEKEKAEKEAAKAEAKKAKREEPAKEQVSIDDFGKLSLKAGLIKEARRHPKADKLLVETVDLGNGDVRQIVSGIASKYAPEDLTGKKVIVVANLKPAKLRGEVSEGMILCTENGSDFEVVFLPDNTEPGSTIR
ncbi:MAG: methionine--tRNA ligase subunit beta, partial [Erysipelotrichaceae bacterium]|nr:methionine--tRNA ligase subunit beta [Erysipelotrichaceae bacterium]